MATNSKVFVSPGVYTSEVDLSFVAQSVGVTTLGIAGETLIGPAFEPIFIRNYDEFTTYFGGTSPEKFVNTQIPKYEAGYIAKAYLQQSNQLFVTRILGLSGYDAGPSWSIRTVANVDPTTIGLYCLSAVTSSATCDTTCVTFKEEDYIVTFTGCTNDITSVGFTSAFPANLQSILTEQYQLFNGSTSTIEENLQSLIFDIITSTSPATAEDQDIYYFGSIPTTDYDALVSLGYTASTNVYNVPSVSLDSNDLTDSQNDPWYYSLFDNNGNNDYSGISFTSIVTGVTSISTSNSCASFYNYSISGNPGSINYTNQTIDVCLPQGFTGSLSALVANFSACTTGVTVSSVTQVSGVTANNFTSGSIVYTLVSQDGSVTTTYTVNVFSYDPCNLCVYSGNSGTQNIGGITTCYSGSVNLGMYFFTGTSYSDYDNVVISTLRSRGISTYGLNTRNPAWEVTGLTDVSLTMSGQYADVLKNPYAPFAVNVTNKNGQNFTFETSFTLSDPSYISKVFGITNFQKPRLDTPLFCEETFQSFLSFAYSKGYIRGLNPELIALDSAQSGDDNSIGWYLDRWQTPSSPWTVSELRGNKVYDLFRFYTVSDGDAANTLIKISIADLSFANSTFTVLVRDYFDTDANPVVLEKFTNCTMNPAQNNFIGVKIGTLDGEYTLNSKFVMVEINEDAPVDAIPCGFNGFNFRLYAGASSPFPIIKGKYDFPGEVIYNPPFGLSTGNDNATTSAGDNIRRTYLGISNTIGYDASYYEYVGKRNPLNSCDIESVPFNYRSTGFHMDKNASGITIGNEFSTAGQPRFVVGSDSFITDPDNPTNVYYRLFARKFTFLVQGGFDGWDIYREWRTNTNEYVIGRTGFLRGACPSSRYPNATGWGAFKQIAISDGTTDFANTDYYAYLLGYQTFANPEAVNINVFVSPGIDTMNNDDLVEDVVNIIEYDRADSLYVVTTADYNMYTPTTTGADFFIYPTEAVDILEATGIDSNYTATYYPWVLTRDTENNTQIYIPATAEVTRNLALTDNIAYPWFAAAGYTRGIVNAVKARKKLTQEDRDILYTGRINPIATFADVGTVIWGNKTLQIRESALDRINVRRLLLQARKLISAVSARLLFEQNDQQVRQDFLNAVNPILDAIRRDRGLYDFRVTVSSDPEDIDRNQMTGKIYIKPTRSLEFIDITFYITPTGASFDNI